MFRCFNFLVFVAIFASSSGVDICQQSQVLTSTSGRLTSPNYPNDYPNSKDCTVTIKLPLDSNITFTFNHLEMESAGGGACYDSVVIKGILEKEFCGDTVPVPYTPAINIIEVQMTTDDSTEEKGFDLSYTSVKVTGLPTPVSVCNTRTISANLNGGRVHSPNYPEKYAAGLDCTLTLNIPANKKTRIEFTQSDIAYSAPCTVDKLLITDSNKQKTVCGTGAAAPIEFAGNQVTIHFKTTADNDHKGFILSYQLIDIAVVNQDCACTSGSTYIERAITTNGDIKREKNVISLKFKTSKANGLFFLAKSNTIKDYLLLKLRNGNIVFEADLGTGNTSVSLLSGTLNDNSWHTVKVERTNKNIKVTVDNLSEANGQCPGSFTKLDIRGPGAVASFLGASSPDIPNFEGCVKAFDLDGTDPISAMKQGSSDYSLQGSLGQC